MIDLKSKRVLIGSLFTVLVFGIAVAEWRDRMAPARPQAALRLQATVPAPLAEKPEAASDPFISKVSDSMTEQTDQSITAFQVLLGGMAPTTQPAGYRNMERRESPDGRQVAYISADANQVSRILVVDRQTSSQATLPAPQENLYECRDIEDLTWDATGQELYVAERATDGVKSMKGWGALSIDETMNEIASKQYAVLYSCKPGDVVAQIIDRIKGDVVSMGCDPTRHAEWLLDKPRGANYNILELRKYADGRLLSAQTINVLDRGNPMQCLRARYVPERNELWFITTDWEGNHLSRWWLVETDLNRLGVGAKRVIPDARTFSWSADGQRVAVTTIASKDGGPPTNSDEVIKILLMQHDSIDRPTVLASKGLLDKQFGLSLMGFSHDGRKIYLDALARPAATTAQLFSPGSMEICSMDLPN